MSDLGTTTAALGIALGALEVTKWAVNKISEKNGRNGFLRKEVHDISMTAIRREIGDLRGYVDAVNSNVTGLRSEFSSKMQDLSKDLGRIEGKLP